MTQAEDKRMAATPTIVIKVLDLPEAQALVNALGEAKMALEAIALGDHLSDWCREKADKALAQINSLLPPAGHSTDDLPAEWPGLFSERAR